MQTKHEIRMMVREKEFLFTFNGDINNLAFILNGLATPDGTPLLERSPNKFISMENFGYPDTFINTDNIDYYTVRKI